jgi:hypothetical protein
MKEFAGCCKTDLHQTNESGSYVSALCDGDFWRVSGDYGVLKAARLEAAQMKFLRHLFGITKLDKEKKPMY